MKWFLKCIYAEFKGLPNGVDLILIGVGTNSGMDYWNGTLDWTTGLNYFPFWDKFLYIIPSTWLLWMIVVMTIVVYCSIFINISKCILENTVYCKLPEV